MSTIKIWMSYDLLNSVLTANNVGGYRIENGPERGTFMYLGNGSPRDNDDGDKIYGDFILWEKFLTLSLDDILNVKLTFDDIHNYTVWAETDTYENTYLVQESAQNSTFFNR